MSWLADLPAGPGDWRRVRVLAPEAFDAVADVVVGVRELLDPTLLELCRIRMATLLRVQPEVEARCERARAHGLGESKIAALPAWSSSELFTARERACLAVAEQFVIDVNGLDDESVEELVEHLGAAGCYQFVAALWATEAFQRVCSTLGIQDGPEVVGLVSREASG